MRLPRKLLDSSIVGAPGCTHIVDVRRCVSTERAAEDIAWYDVRNDGRLGHKRGVDKCVDGSREQSVLARVGHARLEVHDGPHFRDGHVEDVGLQGQHPRDGDLVRRAVAQHIRRTVYVVHQSERALVHDRCWLLEGSRQLLGSSADLCFGALLAIGMSYALETLHGPTAQCRR